jgi:hypothetical protein
MGYLMMWPGSGFSIHPMLAAYAGGNDIAVFCRNTLE